MANNGVTNRTSFRLEPFGRGIAPRADVIAALHVELLPSSPATRLGRSFLERFHYTVLPRAGLVCGAVAYVDEEPAGFVAATGDSDNFMSRAVLGHWLELLMALPSVFRSCSPRRLGSACVEVVRLMGSRARESGHDSVGEILSMGVRPRYRTSDFMRETGLAIAHDLLDAAIGRLQEVGIRRVRAVIDRDNLPAQVLYRNLGWRLDRAHVPGWRTPSVEYVINLPGIASS